MVRISVEDLIVSCLLVDPPDRRARLEELCSTHPDLADALRDRFERLVDLALLSDDDGNMPARVEAAALPEQLGPFRIVDVLGKGGMGVVYLAEQTTLGDRRVAVKALLPERVGDRRASERFVREGLLAARLQHPNLCPVIDVGRDEGLLYLAMPLVEGESLAELIDRRPGTGTGPIELPGESDEPDWRRVVALGVVLARALHFAHGHRLVHRDVKPGNVLVREDGEPVLLDFGLARDLESDEVALTRSLDVMGTPAYMAPEQAAPRGRRTDARTDVYGLGATLFECLTGKLPHFAETREDLLRSIADEPAARLRSVDRSLPRDLETSLAVALETDPDHRYVSAAAMADDLQRVLDGVPVAASRPGPLRRSTRWVRRNKVAAALIVTMAGGLASSLVLNAMVQEESRGRQVALGIAESEVEWGRHKVREALVGALRARELDPNSPRAAGMLMRSLGRAGERVRFESGDTLDETRIHGEARSVAFQDGADVLVRSIEDPDAPTVRLANVSPKQMTWVPGVGAGAGDVLSYDASGRLTRFAPDGAVQWSTTIELGDRIEGVEARNGFCIRASDAEEIVVGTHAGTIVSVDPTSGESLSEFTVGDGTVHAMAFVPGRRELLVALQSERRSTSVFRVNLESEAVVDRLEAGIPRHVTTLQVEERGYYLAYCGAIRHLRVGRFGGPVFKAPALLELLATRNRIRSVDLDGSRLALSINDEAWVFDLDEAANDSDGTSFPHKGAVSRLAFHPDGASLVSTTSDGQVQIRGLRTGVRAATVVQTAGSQIIGLAVAASGRVVVRATDGVVQVLEPPVAPFGESILRHGFAQAVATWADEETLLVSFPAGCETRVLDARTLAEHERIRTPTVDIGGRPRRLELRPPGGISDDSLYCAWMGPTSSQFGIADPRSGEVFATLPLEVRWPDFIPAGMGATSDGRAVAILMLEQTPGDPRTHVTVCRRGDDPGSWEVADSDFQDVGRVQSVCMLDHERVVMSTYDGSVVLSDLTSNRILLERPGISARHAIASPDASRVLAGFADGAVEVVDVESSASTVLQSEGAEIVATAFSSDGRLAVTGDATGEIALWDATKLDLLCRWKAHDTRIRRIVFSPSGARIVSTSFGGTLRTWPTDLDVVDQVARERTPRVVRVK